MNSPYKTFNSAYSVLNGFNLGFYSDLPEFNTRKINMKNYKATLYGAVTYSVIIGAIYVVLSILGLLTRWCVIEAKGSALVYMIYLIYFRVSSCDTTVDWSLLNIDSNIHVQLPDESDAVSRTFIFLVTYLGLHAALIVISLYALCGVNNSCLGRRSFGIFFVPWLIILVAVIVLDTLATVYYVIDTIALTSVDGLMNILQVQNADATLATFEKISAYYRFLPPIIMLITTVKIGVLFITNIVWIVAITKAGWTASTYHKYLDKTIRNYENTMAGVNPAFEGLRDDVVAQKQHERQMEYISDQSSVHEVQSTSSVQDSAENRYQDTTQMQVYAYPYQMSRNDSKPPPPKRPAPQPSAPVEEHPQNPYKIKRPTTLVIPERQSQRTSQEREIDNRLSRYNETSGSSGHQPKLDDISEKQQSNTRVLVLPPITEANRNSLNKPVPPPKPQSNRFSVQPTGPESPVLYRPERTNSTRVERTSSSARSAPEELRSQLPWSYFKPREETPRKALSHVEEDENVPVVPEPDYYGNRTRSNLSDSGNVQRY